MSGENVQGGDWAEARRDGLDAARRFRLPFARQAWRGAAGGWQGSGAGSSIDFQDHRAYVPGDDPRGRRGGAEGLYCLKWEVEALLCRNLCSLSSTKVRGAMAL